MQKKKSTTLLTSALLAGGLLLAGSAMAGASPEMLSNTCAGCHGPDGVSAGPSMPSIAGMPAKHLEGMLKEFKDGSRHSTIMVRVAKGYSDEELKTIAEFYSKLKWGDAKTNPNMVEDTKVDPALAKKGKAIADKQCEKCHEEGGVKQDESTPRMAGQWLDYLLIKMADLKDPNFKVPQEKKMKEKVDKLSVDELKATAHFYASQAK
ncbi:MAG: cytochrome c4 [Magnetococcales bacterium]|nr:cytochrome c4 [Magnetococcales bacterium]